MKRYLTQIEKDNDLYEGQEIYASSWEEAQKIVDKRNLGEVIIGYY